MTSPAVGKTILIFLLILAGEHSLLAQKKDSVMVNTHYTTLEIMEEQADSLIPADTILNSFHQYNPVFSFDFFGTSSGMYGSPSKSWYFLPEAESGFSSGLNSFKPYRQDFKQIRFFDTHTPYTDLTYVQGANELQGLNALHTRNINPFWNVTINYHTALSSEFYGNSPANLKNKIRNLSLTSHVKSKDGRYQLYFAAIKNTFITADNGGINDTSYAKYSWKNKYLAKVYLTYARFDQYEKQLAFQQSFKLEKRVADSLRTDEQKDNGFYIKHQFSYHTTAFYYSDKYLEEDYYKAIYLDSSATFDSMVFRTLENEAWLGRKFREEKGEMQLGVKHALTSAYINNISRSFSDLTAQIRFRHELAMGELKLDAAYVLQGFYEEDYTFTTFYKRPLTKEWSWMVGSLHKKSLPDYIFLQAKSNNLKWSNYFNPLTTNSVYGGMESKKFKTSLQLRYTDVSNYVFLNSQVEPVQLSGSISVLSLVVKNQLKWGVFHFDNHILLQSSSSDFIHVPGWMVNNLTYVEGYLFKKAMYIQAGISLRIHKSFYADALYAPFGLYYNQFSELVNSYPLTDVFINARIKSVRIFVKFEHVNYGLLPVDYYIIPDYPFKQRAFVFGVSWLFFD